MEGPDHRYVGLRRACSCALMLTIGVASFLFGATCIRGSSMEPTLMPGDVVIYRRGCSGIVEGDTVLFEKDGWSGGVVHRVVSIEMDGSLRTCGDANEAADVEPVALPRVQGVVVGVLPSGKTWRGMRKTVSDVLNSSTNRMNCDDGEANCISVSPGTEPHRLEGLRERAGRFTPSAAT